MNQARLGTWLRVIGLPLLLVLLTAAVFGCHYETNDDLIITLLLRGRMASAPVSDLHLYFHGWAGCLAWAYQQAPQVPWYGLLLYALLTLALALLFAVLDQLLRRAVPSGWYRAGLLAFFFLATGLEHVQWFNYVRVPLLLAGAAVLFAAQRGGRSGPLLWAAACLLAAWAIRPSAAMLGAAVALPAAFWLSRSGAWRIVLVAAAVLLSGGLYLSLSRSPEAARYRRLDVLKSNLNDYQLYRATPRTATDSLGVAAVREWALGDSLLVNEALFERAIKPDTGFFLAHTAGPKLLVTARMLGRDYFLLLLLNGMLWLTWPQAKRGRGLYLALAGAALLGLGTLLKLPPRLAMPLLGLITVGHVAALAPGLQPQVWPRRRRGAVLLVLSAASLAYLAKSVHRRQVLGAEAGHNAAVLRGLPQGGPVLVAAGLETYFKSLSPFRQYDAPADPRPWLLLTGWPTLDPSQPRLRQRLTGQRDQPAALSRLLHREGVRIWVAPEKSLTDFCQEYARFRQLSQAKLKSDKKMLPGP